MVFVCVCACTGTSVCVQVYTDIAHVSRDQRSTTAELTPQAPSTFFEDVNNIY